VSDATVKRWTEAGLLVSERTSGGHRRFRVEEVARFQRESELGVRQTGADESAAKTAALGRTTKKSQSDSPLFHALVGGRETETTEILISAFVRGGTLAHIFDTILFETMNRIGELWFAGELNIADEHLATRTLLNAVQKLRRVIPASEANGKLAMCCTMEGDLHELPAHLAQIILESAGLEVLNFGANLPLYVLGKEVLQHRPQLVCLSAAVLPDLERAAHDYKEFRNNISKANLSVVLGGRVFADEQMRRRFPAELHADSFSALAEFANRL
jgi:hypothetical protein